MKLFKVSLYAFWLCDEVSGDDPTFLSLSYAEFVLAASEAQAYALLFVKYELSDHGIEQPDFVANGIDKIEQIDMRLSGVL